MKKKLNKTLLIEILFIGLIFGSTVFITDEKIRIEIIKAGIGVIGAFIIASAKKSESKE